MLIFSSFLFFLSSEDSTFAEEKGAIPMWILCLYCTMQRNC